jgi:Mn2+/Fe2+ NRAMP family transporter
MGLLVLVPLRTHDFTSGALCIAVIVAATLVGMAINFLGINPITALVMSAVLNGIIAVPLIFLVMLVCNDRAAMGERTNGRLLNVIGWVTTIVMGVAAVGLIVTTVFG